MFFELIPMNEPIIANEKKNTNLYETEISEKLTLNSNIFPISKNN